MFFKLNINLRVFKKADIGVPSWRTGMNLPGEQGGPETAGCQAESMISLSWLWTTEFHKGLKDMLMSLAENTILGEKMAGLEYQMMLIGLNNE